MATFQVPQFIEEKAKIVGFLTLIQLFYVGVAGIVSFIFFYIFSFGAWIVLSIFVAGFAIALAFVEINGQPFPKFLKNAFVFAWNPRRYLWQREIPKATVDVSHIEKLEALRQRMRIQEKIKSVALGISTGKLFSMDAFRGHSEEEEEEEEEKDQYQVVTYLTGERKLAKRMDY
ncbi:MAG: PrgI family protein [Patescibacteria group bacterium]